MIDLDAIGRDLVAAHALRVERTRRRRRTVRAAGFALAVAFAFAAVAVASDIGPGLQLDPTKWTILGRGSTDDARGEYVHAQRVQDGSPSTFIVEHDAGLPPYQAFLLHERTRGAADATSPVRVREEPGALCSAAELTQAERVALTRLAAFPAGTAADATKADVDAAVQAAFLGNPCRGLEYASEQARLVYAGVQPRILLMEGAR
ncbi:MAG TPA: hypothetical protein VF101_02005 [Gaiellaceae bacterium]